MLGVIRWTDGPDGKVTFVHPMIAEKVKKRLSERIKDVFADSESSYNTYSSKVKTLENYFMLPEKKSSDGNDSDDSAE